MGSQLRVSPTSPFAIGSQKVNLLILVLLRFLVDFDVLLSGAEMKARVLRVAIEVNLFAVGRSHVRGEVDDPAIDAAYCAALDCNFPFFRGEHIARAVVPLDGNALPSRVVVRFPREFFDVLLRFTHTAVPHVALGVVAVRDLVESEEQPAMVGIQTAGTLGEQRLAVGAPHVVERFDRALAGLRRGFIERGMHVSERRAPVEGERDFVAFLLPREASGDACRAATDEERHRQQRREKLRQAHMTKPPRETRR